MAAEDARVRAGWSAELHSTPDCLPVERLGEVLSADEARHVETCTRCQAELRLFRAYRGSEPGDDEMVVRQVASAVASGVRARVTAPAGATVASPRAGYNVWLRLAAAAVIVVGAGYAFWDPAPGPSEGASGVVRSTAVEIVGPSGDVDAAPEALAWQSIEGAARYDVRVLEVDGTVVWSRSTTETSARVSEDLRLLMAPGKTLGWDVTAIDADCREMARSAVRQFRVIVRPTDSGE